MQLCARVCAYKRGWPKDLLTKTLASVPEQVRELQEQLKPILLRRKKEDVEKSIPQKEEVGRATLKS